MKKEINELFNQELHQYNILIEKLFEQTITDAELFILKSIVKRLGMQDGIFDFALNQIKK